MEKRKVTADDLLGSGVQRYSSDVAWWSMASGQPETSIKISWLPDGKFREVIIDFPDESSAKHFEYIMERYGVCVVAA